MKNWLMIAALGVAPLGCVNDNTDHSVRFLNAFGLEADCSVNTSSYRAGGSLDVAGGGNYLLAMSVESGSTPHPIDVENILIASGEGGNDVNLTEVVYEYVPVEGLDLPTDEEVVPISAVIRSNTVAASSYVSMYAFGPKALAAMQGKTGSWAPITVQTRIFLRGKGVSGLSVTSNTFTFPVTVRNSGRPAKVGDPCPTGYAAAGICNQGQETPACAPPPSP